MTKYFRYVLQNIEPLRIADDSSSQSGQTVSLKYIPGSAIRGFIINRIAEREEFERYKKLLFSANVRYLNAFLYYENRELLPSLKGFYEDKTSADTDGRKRIENGVMGDTVNNKRATLGSYCAMEDRVLCYYQLKFRSDMKIKIGKMKDKKVFRNEYIMAGYQFVGYIALDDVVCDDTLEKMLKEIFQGDIYLGNGRSQGLGKCKIITSDMLQKEAFPTDQMKGFPYEEYSVKEKQEKEVYMMLLSNTVMRNQYGEYCGLDLEWLREKLKVENIEIEKCATSTVNVKGYNRTWGVKSPSVLMYEQGSVFRLTFDGTVSMEVLRELTHTGIGVRRNEGFGRVLFLDPNQYRKIEYKKEEKMSVPLLEDGVESPQDQQVLEKVAKKYYKFLLEEGMRKTILSGVNETKIPNSQVGVVRALLEKNQYQGKKGMEEIKYYFERAYKKEKSQRSHTNQKSIVPFMNRMIHCLDSSLDALAGMERPQKLMGVETDKLLTEREQVQMKFRYLLDLIRYENREGV